MRYFLEIAYNGTRYHGWQVQHNAHSVQAEIEQHLSLVLRQKIQIVGSGRTDTGVHAKQQFAHFDYSASIDKAHLRYTLNTMLPKDIAVRSVVEVQENAHARFDALSRTYEYHISLQKQVFLENLYFHDKRVYDWDLMNEASKTLMSYKDFQAFSKVKTEVEHFLCDIFEAKWTKEGKFYIFHIKANRFLRGMVRAVVGTLLEVGKGKLSLEDFEEVILSKDRKRAGWAVPPQALFLSKVSYPEKIFLK